MTGRKDYAADLDELPRGNLERLAEMTWSEIKELAAHPDNPYDEGFYRAARRRLEEIEEAERIEEFRANGGVCLECWDDAHMICRECERGLELMETEATRLTPEAVTQALHSAGVPSRFREHTFTSFPGEHASAAAVEAFAETWDEQQNLLVSGEVGVGKTGLVTAALRARIAHCLQIEYRHRWKIDESDYRGVRVYLNPGRTIEFTSAIDLANRLRNGYNDGTFAETLERMQTVWLLIVDDVGVERPTDWTREQVTAIIDARYREHLPTWATTNLAPAQLVDHLDARSTSRLFEHCEIISVAGDDLRLRAP